MDNQLIHFSSWCQNPEYNHPSNSVRPPALLSIPTAVWGEENMSIYVGSKNKHVTYICPSFEETHFSDQHGTH